MSFNSIQFAFFLPIVFLLYWFVFNRNLKVQNLFVVVVSYVFYGWWDYRFLFLIAFTSLCSWGSGLLIEKYADNKRKAKVTAGVNIVVNLLILGVFKYYDFFVSSFGELFGVATDSLLLRIILPVGISFYTFQALSYSIDVYRGQMKATRMSSNSLPMSVSSLNWWRDLSSEPPAFCRSLPSSGNSTMPSRWTVAGRCCGDCLRKSS